MISPSLNNRASWEAFEGETTRRGGKAYTELQYSNSFSGCGRPTGSARTGREFQPGPVHLFIMEEVHGRQPSLCNSHFYLLNFR